MPQESKKRPCKHCGSEIPDSETGDFCCTGCDFVYQLIHENGLDMYYNYRDKTIDPVGNRVFHDRDFSQISRWQETQEKTHQSSLVEGNLSLQGISCVGCVWLIERLFQKSPGASGIRIDAHTGKISLTWQREVFKIENFAHEAARYGYILGLSISKKESSSRSLVTRLGLCAAFMMNAMLFTFPRYLGMSEDFLLADLFELLSILFACLSMLVGGSYFIQRAYKSLRVRVLHIDIPIALGLILALVGSFAGWFLGVEDLLYFDFISVFVFLMLGGRWVQEWYVERSRNQWIDSNQFGNTFEAFDASIDQWKEIEPEEIESGSLLRIRPGEVLPVASVLRSGSAEMSLEWINGESEPVIYGYNARIPAGAANLGRDYLEVEAEETWAQSLVRKLTSTRKGSIARDPALDRILQTYLYSILGVAGLALLSWGLLFSWLKGLQVAISVLVISCPCAIGVAWPLAIERSVQFLRRKGVFVREPLIWNGLKKIRHIVFDKTGTLTLESPKIKNPEVIESLSEFEKGALASLVTHSLHPISRTLREILSISNIQDVLLTELSENPGLGVSGKANNQIFFIGKSEKHPGCTVFSIDNTIVSKFQFTDSLRDDANRTLQKLHARGLDLEILSGDYQQKVDRLTAHLDLDLINRAQGEMSPEAKARRIQDLGPKETMMIGDGVNDALAFRTATIQGTPLVDRNLMVERAAFFFTGQGLKGVCSLFTASDALTKAGKAMFAFAVSYNFAVVLVSLAGFMNPLGAAVIMPLSSIFTLIITLSVLNSKLQET